MTAKPNHPILAALAAAALLAAALPARAELLAVWRGAPGYYQTIQAAIDAAKPDDFIEVRRGADMYEGYREALRIAKNDLTIRGLEDKFGMPLIVWLPYRPGDDTPIVAISGTGVKLVGLQIQHGDPMSSDGSRVSSEVPGEYPGVRITGSAVLEGCMIGYHGTGVLIAPGPGPASRLVDCGLGVIVGRDQSFLLPCRNSFGVVVEDGAAAVIQDSQIRYNTRAGLMIEAGARVEASDNLIAGNGLYGRDSPATAGIVCRLEPVPGTDGCVLPLPVLIGNRVVANHGYGLWLRAGRLACARLLPKPPIAGNEISRNMRGNVRIEVVDGSGQLEPLAVLGENDFVGQPWQ